jgi:hypothetical protein
MQNNGELRHVAVLQALGSGLIDTRIWIAFLDHGLEPLHDIPIKTAIELGPFGVLSRSVKDIQLRKCRGIPIGHHGACDGMMDNAIDAECKDAMLAISKITVDLKK